MRPNAEYAKAMSLGARGLNDCEIARMTGVPRGTVRDWRNGLHARRRARLERTCPTCGHPEHDNQRLPRPSYAYLLGMYLGDGSIDRQPRTWRLRIALDMGWPGIMRECANAMQSVFSENRVFLYRPDSRSRCAVAVVYSNQLQFLRGLIHSDGCRFTNRVRARGKAYAYPRYNFTNASDDIRNLFTLTCELLGIEWRQMNARNISIARRDSVARLDRFVGPKQ